nr:hypothetical protein [Nocardia sp. BMG51109]
MAARRGAAAPRGRAGVVAAAATAVAGSPDGEGPAGKAAAVTVPGGTIAAATALAATIVVVAMLVVTIAVVTVPVVTIAVAMAPAGMIVVVAMPVVIVVVTALVVTIVVGMVPAARIRIDSTGRTRRAGGRAGAVPHRGAPATGPASGMIAEVSVRTGMPRGAAGSIPVAAARGRTAATARAGVPPVAAVIARRTRDFHRDAAKAVRSQANRASAAAAR